jgi:formate dehydrogenase assembly factor FdhD
MSSGLATSSTQSRELRRWSEVITCLRLYGSTVVPRDAAVAAEVPIALVYNGLSHVVMMSTPSDLTDFAIGFSISEGILAGANELLELEVQDRETGIRKLYYGDILDKRHASALIARRRRQ